MLVEFRVSNFRSVRDEQALSLVGATADKELAQTHLLATGLRALPSVVRSAVVYGPNASGKSTILMALNYMRAVVAESASHVKPGETYNVQPFKLDAAFTLAPTTFELTFLLDGIRHEYSFAMTQRRIVTESLAVYRTSKPSVWFSRRLREDGESYDYEFSSYLTGSRKLWQESTRANALFLSTAAQLNSELLLPVFRWIVDRIVYLPAHSAVDSDFTTALLATEEGRKTVCSFLSSADISIADIKVVPRKGIRAQVLVPPPGGLAQVNQAEREFLVPVFEHRTSRGKATLEFEEESEGTRRLFGLAAPVLEVLRDGRVLVVDELDSSLHTLMVRRLIGMFHDPALNRSGAQLIFTTHDTSLLDHTLFRRDQIWFAEKDEDQATCLYPLTDFSPRKHEAWEKGYLSGRYGAVPFFRDMTKSTSAPS
ncbi:AAA family ATPase [Ramlibacter sp.]|uniref:AAA family ATPase n=1 Tax=Ramlibacter sp. TaxID=1917967 RepID=UPI003D12B94F